LPYGVSDEKFETVMAFPKMKKSVIFDLNSMITQSYTIIKRFFGDLGLCSFNDKSIA
jgi:hypothetical protein